MGSHMAQPPEGEAIQLRYLLLFYPQPGHCFKRRMSTHAHEHVRQDEEMSFILTIPRGKILFFF